jgi:hypothetical protein
MRRLFIASLAAAAALAVGAPSASADRFPPPPGPPLLTGGGGPGSVDKTTVVHCPQVLGIPGVIVENAGSGTINNCQFG